MHTPCLIRAQLEKQNPPLTGDLRLLTSHQLGPTSPMVSNRFRDLKRNRQKKKICLKTRAVLRARTSGMRRKCTSRTRRASFLTPASARRECCHQDRVSPRAAPKSRQAEGNMEDDRVWPMYPGPTIVTSSTPVTSLAPRKAHDVSFTYTVSASADGGEGLAKGDRDRDRDDEEAQASPPVPVSVPFP
jgi:hypothetical protein